MFSHTFVGVHDFDRALAFYNPLMAVLGIEARFCERGRPWAGWQSRPGPRPLFLIGKPYDEQAHQPGNGQMIAFQAQRREVVDQAYAAALANGGTSEGAPGLRPQYHEHYYGAYFRDPDGNKLCVACHSPADDEPKVQAVRPDVEVMTRQRLPYFVGISGKTVGARGLAMHVVVIPPGGRSEPHVHVGYETGIYVIEGRVRTRWGRALEHAVDSEAGDFLFVPPGLPHEAINLSATDVARAIVARNDPAEHDRVEPYVVPADPRA